MTGRDAATDGVLRGEQRAAESRRWHAATDCGKAREIVV
jgi:hypothetical protein